MPNASTTSSAAAPSEWVLQVETLNEMWKAKSLELCVSSVSSLSGACVSTWPNPRPTTRRRSRKLFARILLLKNTNWGGRTNFELTSSYNDNSWYPM